MIEKIRDVENLSGLNVTDNFSDAMACDLPAHLAKL